MKARKRRGGVGQEDGLKRKVFGENSLCGRTDQQNM